MCIVQGSYLLVAWPPPTHTMQELGGCDAGRLRWPRGCCLGRGGMMVWLLSSSLQTRRSARAARLRCQAARPGMVSP